MAFKRTVRLAALTMLAGALSAVVAASASASTQLIGAGSTLIAPLEAAWGPAWASASGNPAPQYSAVGSGTGLKDIAEGLVDFGASDAPLSASTTPCSSCYQIPWALSATGIGWNVKGVKHLKLTGKVLAEIYLGKITKWNNKAITKLNKHEHFPNESIVPYHRSDGSGDSYAFSNYLSKVSSAFHSQVGTSTKPSFPVGPGADGNSGMVTAVQSTPGSIAYIAVSYLIGHSMGAAAIENAAGRFEEPNESAISDAAKSLKHIPSDRELHIVDPPKSAKTAYPISTFTYVIFRSHDPLGHGAELKSFIKYAIGTGQKFAPHLDFVRLPKKVKSADESALSLIH